MDLPDFEGDTDLPGFLDSPDWTPVDPGTPEWDGQAAPEEVVVEDRFPVEMEQELRGLMFLGSLQKQFDFLGHDFVMATLTAGEELACTLVIKEWEETLGQAKALAMAFVGCSVVSVDGRKLTQPLGPDQTLSVVRDRFEYVKNWYWPVIESLYNEYSALTLRQAEIFTELEGNFQAGRATS